jgi:hypothetical protein
LASIRASKPVNAPLGSTDPTLKHQTGRPLCEMRDSTSMPPGSHAVVHRAAHDDRVGAREIEIRAGGGSTGHVAASGPDDLGDARGDLGGGSRSGGVADEHSGSHPSRLGHPRYAQ